MVRSAVSVYRYYIDWAMQTYDIKSGSGVKQVSQVLAPVLSKIENAVERAYYVKFLAEQLGIAEEVVEEEVNKARLGQPEGAADRKRKTQRMNRRERLERYVISVALHFKEALPERLGQLETTWLREAYTRQLLQQLQTAAEREEDLTLERLRVALPAEQLKLVQDLYTEDMDLMHQTHEELARVFDKSVKALKEMSIKEQLTRLSKKMSEAEGEEVAGLQQEYRELLQRLHP
jgi:DNA primase